jgi:excisionase family DNA binding protein
MTNEVPRMKTAEEVARRLRISTWKLYDLVKQGIIPPGVVVHLGRQVRFSPELEDWLKSGGKAFAHGWSKQKPKRMDRAASVQ